MNITMTNMYHIGMESSIIQYIHDKGNIMRTSMFTILFLFAVTTRIMVAQTNYWVQTNAPLRTTSMVIDVYQNIFLGTENGVYYSTNSGSSWTLVLPNLNISSLYVSSNNIVYAATNGSGIYPVGDGVFRTTSSSSGLNWEYVGLKGWSMVPSITVLPNDTIYAAVRIVGGHGPQTHILYRSTNNGSTWRDTIYTSVVFQIFADKNNQLYFIGDYDGWLYKITGDVNKYIKIGTQSSLRGVQSLAFGENNKLYCGTYDGLYISENNGETWVKVLNNTYVTSILINREQHIFVVSRVPSGIFSSTDKGASWKENNSGLGKARIHSLASDISGFLYAASDTGGVFRSQKSTLPVQNELEVRPVGFSLHQNFPNPFNSHTTIQYSLSRSSKTALIIRNALGQLVWRSASTFLDPGSYTVRWNGMDVNNNPVSSGLYFYTLQTHEGSVSRTLVLLK